MQTSARFQISYPSPDRLDAPDVPTHLGNIVTGIEKAALFGQGPIGARPVSSGGSPGKTGRIYASTDETPNQLYYDYGTGWFQVGALAAGGVGTTQLADGSVTLAKMAANSVDSSKIVDGSITSADIADGTIVAADLAAALKPSGGAGAGAEALRALGTAAGQAAPGAHAAQHIPGGADSIDWAGTIHKSGTLAARPAASATNAGLLYFATDDNGGTIYRSTGSAWVKLTVGVQWPSTYIEWDHTWGVTPDTAFRTQSSATLIEDVHNTVASWSVNAAQMIWAPPSTGMYLVTFGSRHPNTQSGVDGRFLLDLAGPQLAGMRVSIGAGSDPDGSILWSGSCYGPILLSLDATKSYYFGGFWSGGTSQRTWLNAVRLLGY